MRATVPVLGMLALGLAGGGAFVSFTTVRNEAIPQFGPRAWIVPLLFDAGIFFFLTADLLSEYLASCKLIARGLPWARWFAWGLTAGTVYLNTAAAHGSVFGTVTHAGGPGLFVAVTELIRGFIWRRARLERREARKREMQISRPEWRWLLLFGFPAFALWRLAQKEQMLRAYSPGLRMRQLSLDAVAAVPAGAGRAGRRRAVHQAFAGKFAGEPRSGGDGHRDDGSVAELRAELEDLVRTEVARVNREQPDRRRRPPDRRPGGRDVPAAPPLYRELAGAFLERKDFAEVRGLLTGRDDLAGLVRWLAGNITLPGAKRMMALAGLAKVGWDSTPGPVLNWLTVSVPDERLRPDKREITRMAREIAAAPPAGGEAGREMSAA